MSIKIITDSACDLPRDIIEQLDIEVIPIFVYLGEEAFLDGETLKPKSLFQGMREGKVYKTAQIPPTIYKKIFSKYAAQKEDCIYLAFSSQLTGAYASSVLAKGEVLEEYPKFQLDILDTKCASVGFGLVVYKAAQMAKQGNTKAEIVAAAAFNAKHMEHIFTVDNLEYLYRGGRVSKTAAVIGGLLNIKPILNVEEGKLIPLEKVRGRKKLFNRMIDIAKERGVDLQHQTIGINHGDDLEGALQLQEMLEKEFGTENFVINMVGCAIGAHSGPGTLSIFFLNQMSPV